MPTRWRRLPVQLVVPHGRAVGRLDAVARGTVWVGWVCLARGSGGGAVGRRDLARRARAAFVSAVTHELRTPLTTFRMYSEMLAAGMVPTKRSAGLFRHAAPSKPTG